MNTTTAFRPIRPKRRSIPKLIPDLSKANAELFATVDDMRAQRSCGIPPTEVQPSGIDGEMVHQLLIVLRSLADTGEKLQALAKERAVWRGLDPAERRETLAAERAKVGSVPLLDPSEAPREGQDADTPIPHP